MNLEKGMSISNTNKLFPKKRQIKGNVKQVSL